MWIIKNEDGNFPNTRHLPEKPYLYAYTPGGRGSSWTSDIENALVFKEYTEASNVAGEVKYTHQGTLRLSVIAVDQCLWVKKKEDTPEEAYDRAMKGV